MDKITYIRSKIDCIQGKTYPNTTNACTKWELKYRILATDHGVEVIQTSTYLGYTCSSTAELSSYLKAIGKWYHSSIDLTAAVGSVLPVDLNAYLSYTQPVDLQACLRSSFKQITDLQAYVHSYKSEYFNLTAKSIAILPSLLYASLKITLPTDLRATTAGIGSAGQNLYTNISGYCPGEVNEYDVSLRVFADSCDRQKIEDDGGHVVEVSTNVFRLSLSFETLAKFLRYVGAPSSIEQPLGRYFSNITQVNSSTAFRAVYAYGNDWSAGGGCNCYIQTDKATTFYTCSYMDDYKWHGSYYDPNFIQDVTNNVMVVQNPHVEGLIYYPYTAVTKHLKGYMNYSRVALCAVIPDSEVSVWRGGSNCMDSQYSTLSIPADYLIYRFNCELLWTSINSVSPADIGAKLTPVLPKDLISVVNTIPYKPLWSTITSVTKSSYDLGAYVHSYFNKYINLKGILGAVGPRDIQSHIGAVPSVNLLAAIKQKTSTSVDLNGLLITLASETKDLYSHVTTIPYNSIVGYVNPVPSSNLHARLMSFHTTQLSGYLVHTTASTVNLAATLYSVEHKDLAATVWSGIPNLLNAYVNIISLSNLRGVVKSRSKRFSDLVTLVGSVPYKNLGSTIGAVPYSSIKGNIYSVPYKTLFGFVRDYHRSHIDLLAASRSAWRGSFLLNASLYAVRHRNIVSLVYGIPPRDLASRTYAVTPRYLYAYVHNKARLHIDLEAFARVFVGSRANLEGVTSAVRPVGLTSIIQSVGAQELGSDVSAIEHINLIGYVGFKSKSFANICGFVRTCLKDSSSFYAELNAISPYRLAATIFAITHVDIHATTKAIHTAWSGLVGDVGGVCNGGNLYSCPRLRAEIAITPPQNLKGDLFVNRGVELGAYIAPSTIGLLRGSIYGVFSQELDLKSRINVLSIGQSSLASIIGAVPYEQLSGYMFSVGSVDLKANIRSTFISYRNLAGFLVGQRANKYNLSAYTSSVVPENLSSVVNTVPYITLKALSFSILPTDLIGTINAKLVSKGDLIGYIHGPARGDIDLQAVVSVNVARTLAGTLFANPHLLLKAAVGGVGPRELYGSVNPVHKLWSNLRGATKSVTSGFCDLAGHLYSVLPTDLNTFIYSVPYNNLFGHISTKFTCTQLLSAAINGSASGFSNILGFVGSIPYTTLHSYLNTVPYALLVGQVEAVKPTLLYANIQTVPPTDLYAASKAYRGLTLNLSAHLHSYFNDTNYLFGELGVIPYLALNSYLNSISPVDLVARLKVTHNLIHNLRGILLPTGRHVFNLVSTIFSVAHEDLKSVMVSVPYVGLKGSVGIVPSVDLFSYVMAYRTFSRDLVGAIKSIYTKHTELNAVLYLTVPEDLNSVVAAIEHRDFIGFTRIYTQTHYDLLAALRKGDHSAVSVTANIGSIPSQNITAFVSMIEGPTLLGIVRGLLRSSVDLKGYIHGKIKAMRDLPAHLQSYREKMLNAVTAGVASVDLLSFIKAYPQRSINAVVHGYAIRCLGSSIGTHTPVGLKAMLRVYVWTSIGSIIKGIGSDNLSLSAYLKTDHERMLQATIPKYYLKTSDVLPATLMTVPIYLLYSAITGWDQRELTASIVSTYNRYFLHATVYASGGWKALQASIKVLLGKSTSMLQAMVESYKESCITAVISPINSWSLTACLITLGGSKKLVATIASTASYFNEIYSIYISQTANLRATVGYTLCGAGTLRSGYYNLSSLVKARAVYNLIASIEGVSKYTQASIGLGASINIYNKFVYSQYYTSLTERYEVGPIIRKKPVFNKNSLVLTFRVIKGYSELGAFVEGLPPNANLTSSIVPVLLSVAPTRKIRLYREHISVIEDNNIISDFYVDMYFKFKKQAYYANSQIFIDDLTSTIFNIDFDRVKLDAVTSSYRLPDKFYNDSDEAIRYGITKASGYASKSYLGGIIQPINVLSNLCAYVNGEKENTVYTRPYIYVKRGVVSALGCYTNSCVAATSGTMFGGIQDVTASCTALR